MANSDTEESKDKKPTKKLTEKEALFVVQYLRDFNATRAALDAGYSETSARQIGSENLSKPYIRDAIKAKKESLFDDAEILLAKVLDEYKKLAFADITDYIAFEKDGSTHLKDLTTVDGAAVLQITTKHDSYTGKGFEKDIITTQIKLHDKKGSLDSLSRYLGAFKDNLNLSGGLNLIIDPEEKDY